jgi:hypothetical protein
MKEDRGSWSKGRLIAILGIRWRRSNSHPLRFAPPPPPPTRERKPVLTEQEAEWPVEFICTFSRTEEFLGPAGIRSVYGRLAVVITTIIYTQLLRMWNSANLTEREEVWGAFENRMLIRILKPKFKWQNWRYRILQSCVICSLTTIIRKILHFVDRASWYDFW